MNYLREINSFRLYLKTNPIPATAQALWYVLIDFRNSCGWERWITIDNLRLQAELMISKPTLIQHRLTLMQNGLLDYKSQQKRKNSGKYKLLSFELGEVKTGKETGQKILPDSLPDSLPDPLPDRLPDRLPDPLHINKQNDLDLKDQDIKKKSRAFAPPSLEQVTVYCNERKNGIDPQRFIDFYTAKNWFIGKNKMKDWRAAVRTWENRNKEGRMSGGANQATLKFPPASESGKSPYDAMFDR